jgi:hypothetical protein
VNVDFDSFFGEEKARSLHPRGISGPHSGARSEADNSCDGDKPSGNLESNAKANPDSTIINGQSNAPTQRIDSAQILNLIKCSGIVQDTRKLFATLMLIQENDVLPRPAQDNYNELIRALTETYLKNMNKNIQTFKEKFNIL